VLRMRDCDGRSMPWGVNFLNTFVVGRVAKLGGKARAIRTSIPLCQDLAIRLVANVLLLRRTTYSSSISDDVLYILFCVHLGCRISAPLRQLGEPINFEREALAVHDVPMESIELQSTSIIHKEGVGVARGRAEP
jgi:hypothetical protein